MPIIRNFIRRTSAAGLREYFTSQQIAIGGVDWSQDHATVAKNIIQLVDHLDPEDKARLRVDAERIYEMADEIGQAALLSVVSDVASYSELDSAVERSRWVYLHEPDNFRHAEDIRYADQYRHGRDWNSYEIGTKPELHTDPASIASFKEKIRALFGLGEKVKIELFERTLPDDDGNDIDVVQVMVYQEGLPDAYLEFKGEDELVSRIRRPVSEHAITYAKEIGVVEVVARKQERRNAIAKAFTEDLLKQKVEAEKVPLRCYDLMPLMDNRPLTIDPQDGIESVRIVMIKLKDHNDDGRMTFEVPARKEIGLHEYVRGHLGESNPLTSGAFSPTQARISIRFHPENGSNRHKILPVKITMPNGCDLRSRTEHERLIGEKYLKRWGLLGEVA